MIFGLGRKQPKAPAKRLIRMTDAFFSAEIVAFEIIERGPLEPSRHLPISSKEYTPS